MQTPASESPDAALFDVVIRMPLGAKLQTIKKLAETQAGLPPERVERLIKVLGSTPNAKVAAAVNLQRAEEEKMRFVKAGLHAEIVPVNAQNSISDHHAAHLEPTPATGVNHPISSVKKTSDESVAFLSRAEVDLALSPIHSAGQSGVFWGKAGLIVGLALAVVAILFYASRQDITRYGITVPWGKKDLASSPASKPNLPQTQLATAAAVFDPSANPYTDDALVLAAGGQRTGAKSLTMEEAITEATGSPAAGEAVTKQTKQFLTAELAIALAELGQDARAQAVLKAVANAATQGADQRLKSRLAMAQLELQAWSIVRMDSTGSQQAIQALKTTTQAMANAQDKVLLQGQIADILSRSLPLSSNEPRAFLSLAAESLKSISGPQLVIAQSNLAVSMARVFLRETTVRAKMGLWSKAKAGAAQVEGLIKPAPDGWGQARLYAVDYQAKQQTGQNDKAAKSLESALELAGKVGSLVERAVWLRSIAQLSDAGTNEQFETVANALQNQANVKTGLERAQVLTELSLLYIESGLPGRATALRVQAQSTTGLSTTDLASINVDLIARGDMATAKMLHGLGRFAEAEAVLQRLGSYLF